MPTPSDAAQNGTSGSIFSRLESCLAKTPPFVAPLLLALGSLILLPAASLGLKESAHLGLRAAGWVGALLSVLLILLSILIEYVRYEAQKSRKLEAQAAIDAIESASLAEFTQSVEDFVTTIWDVGEALTLTGPSKIKVQLDNALKLLLLQVAHSLGPTGGVRACLFLVDSDGRTLRAHLDQGRHGTPTTREFKPKARPTDADATYELAMNRIDRFVEDTSTLGAYDKGGAWPYGTFATWPVSLSGRLYGIITVDSTTSGDLTNRDLEKLRMFAAICVAVLVSHPDFHWIPTGRAKELLPNEAQECEMIESERKDSP